MNSPRHRPQLTYAFPRRAAVVLGLLALPTVSFWGFDLGLNGPPGRHWGPHNLYGQMFGHACWGASSVFPVLAMWLVGRAALWRSWYGWLRATVYIVAACYGSMVADSLQRIRFARAASPVRASGADEAFVWPGLSQEDWIRSAFSLNELLTCVWLSMILFALMRGRLAEQRSEIPKKGHFALPWLFGLTAVSACVLTSFRILTLMPGGSYWQATFTEALGLHLLAYAVVLTAASLVIIGWSGRWYHVLIATAAAAVLAVAGYKLMAILARLWLLEVFESTVFSGSLYQYASFSAGQLLVISGAFALARFTGVRFWRYSGLEMPICDGDRQFD